MRQSRFWVFVADHLDTIWNKRRAGRAAQMREHLPLVGKAPGINIRRLAYRTGRVQMQRPPSTSSATPVIILASSEHRKLAAWPISCGVEKRPSGIVERNFARISGVSSPMKLASNGVSPATGLSALTRMLNGANSTAMALVAVIIQPFEALYQFKLGLGDTPAVEAIFKMAPDLWRLSSGTRWRAVKKTDLAFTAKT